MPPHIFFRPHNAVPDTHIKGWLNTFTPTLYDLPMSNLYNLKNTSFILNSSQRAIQSTPKQPATLNNTSTNVQEKYTAVPYPPAPMNNPHPNEHNGNAVETHIVGAYNEFTIQIVPPGQ